MGRVDFSFYLLEEFFIRYCKFNLFKIFFERCFRCLDFLGLYRLFGFFGLMLSGISRVFRKFIVVN